MHAAKKMQQLVYVSSMISYYEFTRSVEEWLVDVISDVMPVTSEK